MRNEQRQEVQDLLEILAEHNLTEIEVEWKDFRVRIRREPSSQVSHPRPVTSVSAEPTVKPQVTIESPEFDNVRLLTVTSPIVGTFYRAPSPDTEVYVEENDVLSKGQILCVVEAMKLMNEIESETDGRLVKVLVENGTTVEYGQPLFLIDPITVS